MSLFTFIKFCDRIAHRAFARSIKIIDSHLVTLFCHSISLWHH